MQHFIIGTAGHIDHGKTSLIKALTEMDCDTHPEEKKRGITINLGFAYLPVADDKYLAFVDVPGHHRFINNMISGVSGIDFVMLIIAADDGVMPQTIEHLKICSLLGIKNGIVVINKKDLADEEQLELCKEEVFEFVKDTFLENKPVFAVSSLSSDGISELKDYLLKEDYELVLRERQDFFRMYVDRVFNMSGFGAVATGTVLAGSVNISDTLSLLPNDNEVRIRNIQRHGQSVESAQQRTRVAINITGIKKREIQPGDILTKTALPKSNRIDAQISLLEGIESNIKRFNAIFLTGSYKTSVQVKLLDEDPTHSNDTRFIQITFSDAWYFVKGDHFILRNTSSNATIGGGAIIDPLPLNHKKKSEKLLDSLHKIMDDKLAYMEFKVAERVSLTTAGFFVNILQLREEKILDLVNESKTIRAIRSLAGINYIVERELVSQIKHSILEKLEKFHKTNPLAVTGVSKNKLTSFIKELQRFKEPESNEELLSFVIEELEKENKLIRSQNNWRLPNRRTELSSKEQSQIKHVEILLLKNGMSSLSVDDLAKEAPHAGIDEKTFKYIIKYLADQKKIIRHGDLLYYSPILEKARNLLVDFLQQNKEGITVSQFRDLIQANRKLAIQLFEIFEDEKLVIRKDDFRFLNPNYDKIVRH